MKYVAKTPTQLGQILKGFRQSDGLTQVDVARRMGAQQKTISAVETTTGSISVERLYKALAALGLDLVITKRSLPIKDGDTW
jgi:HTH-type transcriptional regulator/antitoxin HipB